MKTTDITIEIYNRCAGTCTGCMLSVGERRNGKPVMQLHEISDVAKAIAAHGKITGLNYRALLVFGDIPSMPLALQKRYYEACAAEGLSLGVTMTFVDDGKDDHYDAALSEILNADPTAVFDITIDPVRLLKEAGYARRVAAAADRAKCHLQVLLSETVMASWSPEELSEILSAHLSNKPTTLGFAATLSNVERRNYAYDVRSAADYAARFYRHSQEGRAHLERERDRFRSSGTYADFVRQTFHVAPGGFIHAAAYTIFGDIILDGRNLAKPLGSLSEGPIEAAVTGRIARRLSAMNEAALDAGGFGCSECEHRDSCNFSGIGLARMTYKGHEAKIGSCYGPISIGREI